MIYSRHNVFSRITGSDIFFLVNLLSGSADILSSTEGLMLNDFLGGQNIAEEFRTNLIDQGYLVDEKEEAMDTI